jgi:UDP-N-acetylglucosamine acyltransferase
MIHESAIIHPTVELGENVRIGPYVVIGEHVRIGNGVTIGPHAVLEGDTVIGDGTAIYPHATIGTPPQDLKYRGEASRLHIGRGCVIRENVTINRGTAHGGGITQIGDGCLLMANSHVAHDCLLGDRIVLANSVALAGHVHVGDDAWFGGLAGAHQFVRVGAFAFIGAGAMIRRDIPPFLVAKGNRAVCTAVNATGLLRRDFSPERIAALKALFLNLADIPPADRSWWLSSAYQSEPAGPKRGDLALMAEAFGNTTLGMSPLRPDFNYPDSGSPR